MSEKQEKIRRPGKTQRDQKSGAHARRIMNQQKRADWYKDQSHNNNNFPVESCNGKRNRYRVTGKGGASIILKKGSK